MSQEREESGGGRLSAPITGFVDYSPQEQCLFNTFLKTLRTTYERFGFTPLHLRPFERMGALQGEGETQKQIFEIFRADTGHTTGLGLPFDHTVPLALWVAEHAGHLQHLPLPYKRYDLGLSYRGERPKTGRLRAFVQADVDIVGRKLPLSADAECVCVILEALQNLQIGTFQVYLNHIGIVKSLLNAHHVPELHHAAVLRAIDKLDKINAAGVLAELEKIEQLSAAVNLAQLLSAFTTKRLLDDPDLASVYGEEAMRGVSDLRAMIALLTNAGHPAEQFLFAPHMVRGLAYYTGIVFETHLIGYEQYGSMASGGRYSQLVGDLGKGLSDVEGVGGSIGLSRLFDVLISSGFVLPQRKSIAQILVGVRAAELSELGYSLSMQLRRLGKRVDVYSGPAKVKNALGHAVSLGVDYTALVMDTHAIVIKQMHTQTQQEFQSIEEVLAYFQPLN